MVLGGDGREEGRSCPAEVDFPCADGVEGIPVGLTGRGESSLATSSKALKRN